MSNEELVDLIQRGVDASDSMGLLYEQNTGYIHTLAKRFSFYEPLEDLMNEAYFGLHEAVQHYEADKGVLFMTYAGYWIKQQLIRHIETCCQNVRIPSHMRGLIRKYESITKEFLREMDREPTDAELRFRMGLSQEQLDKVKMAAIASKEMSLNTPLTDDDGEITLQDTLRAEINVENSVVEEMFNEQLNADLWALVDGACTAEEARVINLRYRECMTRENIGEVEGETPEEIRLREDKALRKLRRGRLSRKFRDKYETEIAAAYRNSVSGFMRTWTSSTEKAALRLYELEGGLAR